MKFVIIITGYNVGLECRRSIFVDSELPYFVGLTKLSSNEVFVGPPSQPEDEARHVYRGMIKSFSQHASLSEKKARITPHEKESKSNDESGIRTHAPEETRSLVWRLRPLGHLAPQSEPLHWTNRDSGVVWDGYNHNENTNAHDTDTVCCSKVRVCVPRLW